MPMTPTALKTTSSFLPLLAVAGGGVADTWDFCTCLECKVSREETFRQLITSYLLSKNG